MRRFIALVLCIVLCFGLFAVPAFALDATHIYTACGFWSFLNRSIFSGIYDVADALWGLGSDYYGGGRSTSYNGGGRSDADLQSAYNSYVSDLDSAVISSDGAFRIYPVISSVAFKYTGGTKSFSNTSLSVDWTYSQSITNIYYLTFSLNVSVLPAGTISYVFSSDAVSCSPACDITYSLVPGYLDYRLSGSSELHQLYSGNLVSVSDGATLSDLSGVTLTVVSNHKFNTVFNMLPYVLFTPATAPDLTSSVPSRASSVLSSIMQINTTNNAYYIGTKDTSGAVTNVYTTNIFNEETKVFTVPGEMPVEHTVTNWNYDYSTRTYNCTDGTNNYVVTYGDDHITVTVPDGSGGTISTDYYYVHQTPVPTPAVPGSDTSFPGASSDNFEDDPNTTGGFFSTVWKAFKDGLASLIAGIIKGLFKGIKALIDGITSVFSGLVSGFFGFVSSFFNSFGTGPGAVGEFFGGGVVDLD